jgi:hypothetical protein
MFALAWILLGVALYALLGNRKDNRESKFAGLTRWIQVALQVVPEE